MIKVSPINSRKELEACFDLWADVFPEKREFFQRRLDLDPEYRYWTTWTAMVDGELASAVQVFLHETRIEPIDMKIVGIGNVATLPKFRGLGLAKTILTGISHEYSSFDASLLFTDIHSYYEPLGWHAVVEDQWVFERNRLVDSLLSNELRLTVRRFKEDDIPALSAVYEKWCKSRIQPRSRTLEYWRAMFQWQTANCWVAEYQGDIVAYMLGRTVGEKVFEVRELTVLPEFEALSPELVVSACRERPEVEKIWIRLPFDGGQTSWVSRLDGFRQPFTPMMWKAFDAAKLLRKMAPIFEKRACSIGALRIMFELPDCMVLVNIAEKGTVDVIEDPSFPVRYDKRIHVNPFDVATLIFYGASAVDGSQAADEWFMHKLFPPGNGLLWSTDFF